MPVMAGLQLRRGAPLIIIRQPFDVLALLQVTEATVDI